MPISRGARWPIGKNCTNSMSISGAPARSAERIAVAAHVGRGAVAPIESGEPAGLHRDATVGDVDAEDAVHAGEFDDDRAVHRQGPPAQIGPGAARNEGETFTVERRDHRGDLRRRAHEHHRTRQVLLQVGVVGVGLEIDQPVQHILSAYKRLQLPHDGPCDHESLPCLPRPHRRLPHPHPCLLS